MKPVFAPFTNLSSGGDSSIENSTKRQLPNKLVFRSVYGKEKMNRNATYKLESADNTPTLNLSSINYDGVNIG